MPGRNTTKVYLEECHYHIYNRGVEKRRIFIGDTDYKTFLSLLGYYLTPADKPLIRRSDPRKTLPNEINLLSYSLMPNHFHLLIKQRTKRAITQFVRCLCTNYAMYFNKKHKRVGTLFQGRYKAVIINDEASLLHISRYIHVNPLELPSIGSDPRSLSKYRYSSYADYLGKRRTGWVKTGEILNFFKSARRFIALPEDFFSYQSFVEDYKTDSKSFLGKMVLE